MAGSANITGTQHYVLGIGHPQTNAPTENPPVTATKDAVSGVLTLQAGKSTIRTRGLDNFLPSFDMPNARAQRKLQQQSKAPFIVGFNGDSTTVGYGAGTVSGTLNVTGAFKSNVASQVASILKQLGVNATNNAVVGTGNNAQTTYTAYNPNITLGSGWTLGNAPSVLGGGFFQSTAGSGNLDINVQIPFDTFAILEPHANGSAVMNVAVDGSTAGYAPYSCAGTAVTSTDVYTIPGLVRPHTVSIANAGAATGWCNGLVAWNSNATEIICTTIGASGATIADLILSNNSYLNFTALAALQSIGMTLVIENCTINDQIANTSVATYMARKATLLNRYIALGMDVVVLINSPNNSAGFTNNANDMATQIKALCNSLSINCFDLREILGNTWVESNALGYMDSTNIAHPSSLGYSKIAESIASLIAFN